MIKFHDWQWLKMRCRCVEWSSCLITTNIEKFFVEPKIGSFTTNVVFETNYMSIKPQIGRTFHEYAIEGLYVSLEKITPTFIHLSTLAKENYFLI
jgi:hypothetical protein